MNRPDHSTWVLVAAIIGLALTMLAVTTDPPEDVNWPGFPDNYQDQANIQAGNLPLAGRRK